MSISDLRGLSDSIYPHARRRIIQDKATETDRNMPGKAIRGCRQRGQRYTTPL